jgi:precorrin-6A/cobalt-precorrin-6A reductase
MILVLAGTQDGRELTKMLLDNNYQVMASVTSDYGKKLLQAENLLINDHPLDLLELEKTINDNHINLIVDASHPYAVNISKNAIQLCKTLHINYIRYERANVELPNYDKIFFAENYQIAANLASNFGGNIFLTTGSRMLHIFVNDPALKNHTIIARVLPEAKVMEECMNLGFTPKTLIAMQGPFSHELNVELYKKYDANVIITKNSGSIGGTDTKITAAMTLGLPIVIIDRPKLKYELLATDFDEVLSLVKNM